MVHSDSVWHATAVAPSHLKGSYSNETFWQRRWLLYIGNVHLSGLLEELVGVGERVCETPFGGR